MAVNSAFIPEQGGDWVHGWDVPTPSTRHGFYLSDPIVRMNLASFTDTEPHHAGYGGLRNPWVLRRGDTVVERGGWSRDTVEVPAGRARYTLVKTNSLTDEFRLSTHARTAWGFNSQTSNRVLPLLMPRYDLPVDHQNRLPAGRSGFRLAIPRLGATRVHVKLPTVKVSYNGGESWTKATVARRGSDRFRVRVVNPRPGDWPRYGSLLVAAEDRAGNTVREVVTRAWRIRG